MGASLSVAQYKMQLKPGTAEKPGVFDEFCARLSEPGFVSSLLESVPLPMKSGKASSDGSKTVLSTGDSAVDYLLSPDDIAARQADVELGTQANTAGLLPGAPGDARARAFLVRLFKSVSGGHVAGATFTGRLERRLALSSHLLAAMQVRALLLDTLCFSIIGIRISVCGHPESCEVVCSCRKCTIPKGDTLC